MPTTTLTLQKFLTEQLAEKIKLIVIPQIGMDGDGADIFKWINSNGDYPDDWFEVRDTEWDYIVRLVEGKLTEVQKLQYVELLATDLSVINW